MTEVNATKMMPAPFSREIFDQTALLDQVDVITSTRMMKILRNLRNGPVKEGTLAAKCGERMYIPDWGQFITTLLQWGWIKATPTLHGGSKEISLTPVGEEFLSARLDPRPVPVEE